MTDLLRNVTPPAEVLVEVHVLVKVPEEWSYTAVEEMVQRAIWRPGFKRAIPGYVNAYVADVRGDEND